MKYMNESIDMPPYKDYSAYVSKIITMGIPSSMIYKNWGDDESTELQTMFNFFQGYLESGMSFSSSNTYFFYSTDPGIGGAALTMHGNNFIKINIDTHEKLNEIFSETEKLFEKEDFERLRFIDKYSNTPLKVLMKSICINFTYYHELAHCIQDSEMLLTGMAEEHDSKKYSFEKHVLEYDADIFSALSICTSVFQYFENYYERKTKEILEELIAILLSAILVRIFMSPNIKLEFYLKKESHPHWIIRMVKIIEIMINHIQNIVNVKYPGVVLNRTLIAQKSNIYSKLLGKELVPNFNNTEIEQILYKEVKLINQYSNELLNSCTQLPNSAYMKWNARASG